MRRFIAKSIGFPFQDYYKNTKVISTLKFLNESMYLHKDELENLQLEKLKKLINHAYYNVPYYQNLFNSNGLKPSDIKVLKDLHKIPVLTKERAKETGADLFDRNLNKYDLKHGATGGTTGPPFKYIKDTNTRSFVWAAFYRWYGWMGIRLGDPVLVLWGAPEVLKVKFTSRLKNFFLYNLENTLYINSFNLNEDTFPEYIKKIQKFKPKLIRGYLSAILQLARYIEENKIKGINPVSVSTTTETLLPPYKNYIEKVFNAPVYDQYGCGECGSIGFECKSHNGLHINMEHVIIEVLNSNNENIQDQEGNIILTDLDNFAMPFIRYENGDSGLINKELCTCGVNSDLIKNLSGRSKDTIILKDGSRVHGVFFTDIFNEIQLPEELMINRFQVYQNIPGEIELRIETLLKTDNIHINKILHALTPFFIKVNILTSIKLENDKSGKFRYIISENEFI